MTTTSEGKALGEFEGAPVLGATLKLNNVPAGLNDAASTDPVVLHRGDRVMLVLEGIVTGVGFDEVKNANAWQRRHTITCLSIAIAQGSDVDAVAAVTRRAQEARKRAAEEREGVQRLDFEPGGPDDPFVDDEIADAFNVPAIADPDPRPRKAPRARKSGPKTGNDAA